MESIKLWKQETALFLCDLLKKIEVLSKGKSQDKDRRIMHFLFSLYLKFSQDRDWLMCEFIKEYIDKFSFYGLRILKKEIKQSIIEFQA